MGKSRNTRSTEHRGSSQPPPGSAADLRDFFLQPASSPGRTSKMAPDPSMTRSRSSAQKNPTAYTSDRTSAESLPASDTADSPSTSGAVSTPSHFLLHEVTPRGVQAAMLPPPPPPHYTQCSDAFPRLLRTASDPCMQGPSPGSPSHSESSLDFPTLPGPIYPAVQTPQEPVRPREDFQPSTHIPPPHEAQRLSPTQAPSSPVALQVLPAPTSSQKGCSPAPRPPNTAAIQPPRPDQVPPWGDQWASPAGLAYLAHGYTTPHSQPLSPRLPPPEQHPMLAHVQPPPPQWQSYLQAIPTKEDFRQLVEDVKSTCRSEIQALQSGLRHLADRVEMAEEDIQDTKLAVHRVQTQGADHRSLLRDMQRHVEDLDNRGRRNNIRVRGVPESDGPEDIKTSLQTVFNNLLGKPPTTHIEMDRAHRALRPKGANSKPRDIICRISSYPLKEEIMRQARLARKIMLHDAPLQLYPDLSWITLQKRRLLQPLLHALQEGNILYRWGFPFSLTANHQGKSAALRYPEDLPAFCDALGISVPQLPEWDLVATPPPPPATWQKVPSSKRSRNNGASRKAARHSNG